MADSLELLADYSRNGSEEAFRELVARYVDLVYSAALRLVEGDRHLAEDVAQTVFTDLSRKAKTLLKEVMLGGWLHRHTCFVAANTMRGERRRQLRERQAVEMNFLNNDPAEKFSSVAPILDAAINELSQTDRTAISLRFFEQLDFRAVGQALGSGEDAARMRVNRALEKLEMVLKRRGVTAGAASLAAFLSAGAIQSAPVGLAAIISTSTALAGTAITTTTLKTIAMTTLQKTFVTAVLAAAVATPLVRQHHANTRLRDENSSLRQQLAQQSQAADERLAQLQAGSAELDRLRQDHSELARLRADVSRQRARQPQPKTLPDSTAPTGPLVPPPVQTEVVTLPKDSWSDAGFDTPRAALKTRGWTVLNGNRERFKQSLFVTDGARKRLEDMFVQLASASTDPNKDKFIQEVINQKFGVEDGILMPLMALNQQQGFTGYRVLSEKSPAEGEAILEVETQMVSAPAQMESLKFRRFDNEWKVVIDEDAIKPH